MVNHHYGRRPLDTDGPEIELVLGAAIFAVGIAHVGIGLALLLGNNTLASADVVTLGIAHIGCGVAILLGTSALTLDQIAHSDVDGDGVPETAAVLRCQKDAQVVVFDRDPAGVITTVGQVVRTGDAARAVFDVQADGSRVAVEVGDYTDCCGESPAHRGCRRLVVGRGRRRSEAA